MVNGLNQMRKDDNLKLTDINWQNPSDVRRAIKTLELTHPYEKDHDDDGNERYDHIKYLESKMGPEGEATTIALFREPEKSNGKKLVIETDTHAIAFNKKGEEIKSMNGPED